MAWVRLILQEHSPLVGMGSYYAPSLLFPMERVFEDFVAKYLKKQIKTNDFFIKTQVHNHALVEHKGKTLFGLKPDLLLVSEQNNIFVMDTKWKLINSAKRKDSYGLRQSDFYQLHAYGHHYLNGEGCMALIYPKTEEFSEALPVFNYSEKLRLWVLPFDLENKNLCLPDNADFDRFFRRI
jgi:5-methylcytosine-specific restriction enzyme subunit McrC